MLEKYLDNHYQAILSQIRDALTTKQITQSELGEKLGINQSSVSALLKGTSILSLVQFLKIAEVIGMSTHQILNTAEKSLIKAEPMPENVEKALYKSPAHLLGYCSATKPVQVKDLTLTDLSEKEATQALKDLQAVGVLVENKGKFIQSDQSKQMEARSRAKSADAHRKVCDMSWKVWIQHLDRVEYRQKRFNFYLLERFTVTQIKEIEALSWQVYEKAMHFQKENMARNYDGDVKDMPLWNIHVMLMTPLEKN